MTTDFTPGAYSPATTEPIDGVESTPPGEVADVVARAEDAQPAWAKKSLKERRKLLEEAAQRVLEGADEIADIVSMEEPAKRR